MVAPSARRMPPATRPDPTDVRSSLRCTFSNLRIRIHRSKAALEAPDRVALEDRLRSWTGTGFGPRSTTRPRWHAKEHGHGDQAHCGRPVTSTFHRGALRPRGHRPTASLQARECPRDRQDGGQQVDAAGQSLRPRWPARHMPGPRTSQGISTVVGNIRLAVSSEPWCSGSDASPPRGRPRTRGSVLAERAIATFAQAPRRAWQGQHPTSSSRRTVGRHDLRNVPGSDRPATSNQLPLGGGDVPRGVNDRSSSSCR